MKKIESKKVHANVSSDTYGISDQISKALGNKVYSIMHGSGTAIWIKHSDGKIYEIDIRPSNLGSHQETAEKFIRNSENEDNKFTMQEMKSQQARGQRPIENWPTEANNRKVIIEAKKTPAWQRSEGKSKAGGLNEKGRKSYEKDNPGSDLKPPVTEDNPKGKRKKRQNSYCARSQGQMDDHNIDCRKDPDKPICKSRKRWNC